MKVKRFWRVLALILPSLLILVMPAVGADQGERVIITLPESATVHGKWLILGEIGEISGPTYLAAELAAVNAGAAPGAGTSRQLTKGQIEVRIRQAKLDLSRIEFRGAATVNVVGATADTAPPQAADRVEAEVKIIVAARDLARGEVLTAEDLALEEGRARTASSVYNLAELMGLRTTRHIRSGTEITLSAVERIPAIDRGDAVTIVARTGAMSVSAPGTARAAGQVGDIIPVENSLSRKIVYGKIIAADTVEVDIRGSSTP